MRTWGQIKLEYQSYLRRKELKQPQRRIAALNKIEEYLQATHPSAFRGYTLFATINKSDLKQKFEAWKGKTISGAESQVINDFYKLALAPARHG